KKFDRPLEKKTVELTALLRQSVDDVRPFIELRKQTLDLQVDQNLGSMELDELKIRDCINHLLLNAVKFTPDNGRIGLAASGGAGGLSKVKSQNFALICCLVTATTAIIALVGAVFDIETFRNILPGRVPMNPLSAIAFVLGAISLWVTVSKPPGRGWSVRPLA